MRTCGFATVIMVVLLSVQLFAFDGQRKGFVLGGGIGFSPVSRWSAVDKAPEQSSVGLGGNVFIGYAFDNANMFVLDADGTLHLSRYYSRYNDRATVQGIKGVAWYHYFGPAGKCAFSTAGIGIYDFSSEGVANFRTDLGLLFGGGYEYYRHWQVGVYLGIGRTNRGNVDYNNLHLTIAISTVAF